MKERSFVVTALNVLCETLISLTLESGVVSDIGWFGQISGLATRLGCLARIIEVQMPEILVCEADMEAVNSIIQINGVLLSTDNLADRFALLTKDDRLAKCNQALQLLEKRITIALG